MMNRCSLCLAKSGINRNETLRLGDTAECGLSHDHLVQTRIVAQRAAASRSLFNSVAALIAMRSFAHYNDNALQSTLYKIAWEKLQEHPL